YVPDQTGPFSFNFNFYHTAFKAPAGTRIKDIHYKAGNKLFGGTNPGGMLILLDNGDVYWLPENSNRTSYLPYVYDGHIGSAGSESWEKVIGDALYALSSSYIYVSRDSAHSVWTVDTS